MNYFLAYPREVRTLAGESEVSMLVRNLWKEWPAKASGLAWHSLLLALDCPQLPFWEKSILHVSLYLYVAFVSVLPNNLLTEFLCV